MTRLPVEWVQQQSLERTQTLEVIETKKKTELLQLKFEFVSHYLLGIMVKPFNSSFEVQHSIYTSVP